MDMGPVLSFRGWDPATQQWALSALVVAKEKPGPLAWRDPDGQAEAEALWTVKGRTAWRYRFAATLAAEAAVLEYAIDGSTWRLGLPAAGTAPRMAYASCNGFSSLKDMKRVADKNAMWSAMGERHAKSPYHLLLLGGDQVYADSMWAVLPTMRAWNELGFAAGNAARFTAAMRRELEAFYFDLYAERWAQPEIAAMLAALPGIAMWDDHDILDGWGSYPGERQQCDVFQGLLPIARRAFEVFQQHLGPDEVRPGALEPAGGALSFGHVLPHLAILALDMRSERSATQVISPAHWERIYAWLNGLPAGLPHLLLMSSIPVVYPGFETFERILGAVPGQQELEDDVRDHWRSRAHKGERSRLVHRLLDLALATRIRPTILSGDVHVAALGTIESIRDVRPGERAGVINQLISSGIVHPSPGAAVVFALRHLFDNSDEIDNGITARMVEFPGTQHRFIGSRNFLSLEPDAPADQPKPRLWANWIAEGEAEPYVKVIHPI